MGHGDANTLVHIALQSDGASAAQAAGKSSSDVLDDIYSGAKAHLRPIHDRIMTAVNGFGEFEIAPKKGYVSLRWKKQFATIGPGAITRVDVGLNMKDVKGTARLEALPPGGMCQYKVRVTDHTQVDAELIAWIRRAYDSAG
jgi:UDP-galactopyranose mutase